MKITMTKAERENLKKQIGEIITRSAYEASITTTGKKENSIARENLANAKVAAQNLNQDITKAVHEIMAQRLPYSEETKLRKELENQMVFIDIDDYENAGIRDAESLKRSFGWERRIYYDRKAYNAKMTEYRKAYRKDKNIYNAAAAKLRYDAKLNLKGLTHLLETNGQEYADKRYSYVVTAIAEIETAGDQQTAEHFKAELQKVMDKYGYSPKATDIDVIDDHIVTQDAQLEAQAAEQAEANISAIHRKVEENPDLEMRAAVNHWMKSDDNAKSETIDATKIEVTEDTEVKEIVYSIAYDDDMYQINAETLAPYGGVKTVAGRVPVDFGTVKVNAFITQVKGKKRSVDTFVQSVIVPYSKHYEIHNIATHGKLELDNFNANAKAIATKYYSEHLEDPVFLMVDEIDEQSGLPVIKVRNAFNEKINFFVKGHAGNLGLIKAIEMDIAGDAILENNKYLVRVSDANCNLVVSETVDTPEEAIPILKKYAATNPSGMVVKSHYARQLRDEGFSYYLYDSRDKDTADKLSVLTGKATPVIEISKTDYANNLANAVANSPYARHRWDVYTIKNAANLKSFDDVRIAAQKVLDEGFDSFTVGDYINLTA